MDKSRIPVPRDDLLFRELGEGSVVYDPLHSQIHTLNKSATLIWLLCDGQNSLAEIIDFVQSEFEQFEVDPWGSVECIIEDFESKNLLQ